MATKIGEAFVQIEARMEQYEADLKKAKKEFKEFTEKTEKSNKRSSDSFVSLGKQVLGFAAIAKGLSLVYTKLIKPASDLQETNQKFGVVFREVSEEAVAMSDTLVESYGVSTNEARSLLAATGDLLTGFGATGAEALNLSGKVQKLAIDLASFTNLQGGATQASRALTSGMLGEREALKTLGIVILEADVKARVAAEGKAKLTGESLLLAKAEAVLTLATEQSKNAIGDFSRSSNSFANIMRRVEATMSDASAELGTRMIPGLESLGIAFLSASKDGGVLGRALKLLADFANDVVMGFALIVNSVHLNHAESSVDDMNEKLRESNKEIREVTNNLKKLGVSAGDIKSGTVDISGLSMQDKLLAENLMDNYKVIISDRKELNKEQKKTTQESENALKALSAIRDRTENNTEEEKKGIAQNKKKNEAAITTNQKLLKEAQKFADEMSQLLESPAETEDRVNQERLKKAEELHKKGLLNEEEYQKAIASIRAAHRQNDIKLAIVEFENYNSSAEEFAFALDDMLSVFEDNKIMKIQEKEVRDLKALDDKFAKEQDVIKSTIKNKKKQDKALEKLEKKKAEEENAIKQKADDDEKALKIKQFNRNKAMSLVSAGIATALAVVTALTSPMGPPATIVFALLAAAAGAAAMIAIAASKPPAMAKGGIVSGRTFAELGEEGAEMVTPLEGTKGKAARQLFVNDLIDTIGSQAEAPEETAEIIGEEESLTFNATINIGGDEFFGTITQGINNREILLDERAITKR